MSKVRRAYLVDDTFIKGEFTRALVKEYDGFKSVFYGAGIGWRTYHPDKEHLVYVPGSGVFADRNGGIDFNDWWDGWWEHNYRLTDWDWIYGVIYEGGFWNREKPGEREDQMKHYSFKRRAKRSFKRLEKKFKKVQAKLNALFWSDKDLNALLDTPS